jgi:predicted NBD/HSP70 family sugar kinase
MSRSLLEIANRLLLDGDDLRRTNLSLRRYYQRLKKSPSSVAAATKGLGMSRYDDRVRALVTGDGAAGEPVLSFGPSAGLVLGVSLGGASIRAALVDANGWLHEHREGEQFMGQLQLEPSELFERIRHVCERVLDGALQNKRLLVQGALPFMGIAVAWPAPLDSEKFPHAALTHPSWHSHNHGVDQLLARHLAIERDRSHALNDASAAALAVAFDDTREQDYRKRSFPRQLIVVRLGGGLGASTIVVEPLRDGISGWMRSLLPGGHHGLAGEIGHTPVDQTMLTALEQARPRGCPRLRRVRCSCARDAEQPDHIEAYACAAALAARFGKAGANPTAAVEKVLGARSAGPYRHALEDTGRLLGDCLLPSVLMLSPHEIVITGRLATPEVSDGLEAHLDDCGVLGRVLGATPDVRALSGEENDYVRVRGAALAVLRRHVHRRLEYFFSPPSAEVGRRLATLTRPITDYPWSSGRRRR